MPDAHGRFKGISVPRLPWSRPVPGKTGNPLDPIIYDPSIIKPPKGEHPACGTPACCGQCPAGGTPAYPGQCPNGVC